MSDRSDWCTPARIQELAKQADPNLTLDNEAQQVMQDIAEDFVENVAAFACELVKHRAGETLEVKDLQLAIEKNWNMRLPGIGDNELKAAEEGLTLLVADNKTGYFGVYLSNPGHLKPYQAQVWRGGKLVHLGCFATAEEAALCIARSPEGQAAAAKRAAAANPLTSEEARQQAEAEGLTLLVADNKAGYFGVTHTLGKSKPYRADVMRGGTMVYLGCFATAEEAALCIARSPEGQAAAAKRAAAAPPLTSEEARQQAEAEGLTLRVAYNKAGYFGVHLTHAGESKPYQARVTRGGKSVSLGCFVTAEEAALCVARTPEGRAAAKRPAAAPPSPPLTSEEARQQALAEGLTLLVVDSKAGYFGVTHKPGRTKPYQAQVTRGGTMVHLGSFATAEEAALCFARSPEGRAAAAKRAAAAPPLTSEEARQQARAEGLTLLKADNKVGYYGVAHNLGHPKPYQARVTRGGKSVHVGSFATAEEAALCVARSPEGREAARKAAAAPQLSEEQGHGNTPARRSRAVLKQEGAVPPMPSGAFVKEEGIVPPMPPSAFVKEEVVVKREHEDVVDEAGRSEGRPKRRKNA